MSAIIGPQPTSKSEFVPKYILQENQKDLLERFQEKIAGDNLTEKQKRFCTDDCLCRYLRAREWDLQKAYDQLKSTLTWREEFQPDQLHPDLFIEESRTGKMYRQGYDKTGRPVVYLRPRHENTKDYDNQLKLLVYTLEQTIRSMDQSQGVESWVFIFDFNGYSLRNSPPTSLSLKILEILTTHYPERLSLAIMLDPPYIFSFFWKIVSPFVPSATFTKIKFCSGNISPGSEKYQLLCSIFNGVEQIEKDLGGELDLQYNHETYWKNEYLYHQIEY